MVRDAVVATINAGTTLRGLGGDEKAAAFFDVAESVARQIGWSGLLGISRTPLGAFLSARGRLEEAHQLLVEAHLVLTPMPPGVTVPNPFNELALVRLRLGRPFEAVEPMTEAIRMLRAIGAADNLAVSLIDHSTILSAANRLPDALEAIAEARRLLSDHGLDVLAVNLHQALAEIHRRHALPGPPGMGEPTAALHHAEQALREGRRYPALAACRQGADGAGGRLVGCGRPGARLHPRARSDQGDEERDDAAEAPVAEPGSAASRARRAAGGREWTLAPRVPAATVLCGGAVHAQGNAGAAPAGPRLYEQGDRNLARGQRPDRQVAPEAGLRQAGGRLAQASGEPGPGAGAGRLRRLTRAP